MPGFYITNCRPVEPIQMGTAACLPEHMTADSFHIYRSTRAQFLDDKLFFQNDAYVIVLEAVLMNKTELMQQ